MHSLKELYKIGNGPSSSHTMGPKNATLIFNERFKNIDFAKVILYGSLAMTGKGHLTNKVIDETLAMDHEIVFNYYDLPPHPNTIDFIAYVDNEIVGKMRVYSVGGGSIEIEGEPRNKSFDIYQENTLFSIKEYCQNNNLSLAEYVYKREGKDFKKYLDKIYNQMLDTINIGLSKDGELQGKLHIKRKAKMLYEKKILENNDDMYVRLLYSYAYAVAEENADGGVIVTAPTCGSCGVLPAVLRYSLEHDKVSKTEAINGLAVAGLIGNLVKSNASISGAEAGCQAEIGTACAMAAAYYSYVRGANLNHIEQSAEIALEHHLGLTCDPIMGYVQIPCIERNAVAAIRAIDAFKLSNLLYSDDSKISFDLVVKTMLETGKDIENKYRETSKGGLAKYFEGDIK